MLAWARAHLTCEAMAKYLVSRSSWSAEAGTPRVLFVSHHPGPDYIRDGLAIGFKNWLGANLTESFCVPHLRGDVDAATFERLNFHNQVAHWAQLRGQPCITHSPSQMRSLIAARSWDLVVFGAVTRENAYVDEIRQAYPPDRVLTVNGEDCGHGVPHFVFKHSQWSIVFLRESCNDRPAQVTDDSVCSHGAGGEKGPRQRHVKRNT